MPFTPAPSAAARPPSGTSRGLPPPLAARPVTAATNAAPAPAATVRPTPPASIRCSSAHGGAPKPPPIATNSSTARRRRYRSAGRQPFISRHQSLLRKSRPPPRPPIRGARRRAADQGVRRRPGGVDDARGDAGGGGAFGRRATSVSAEVLGQPTATNEVNWLELSTHLPFGRGAAERAARDELWRRLDEAGNGYLSLAELDKGMRTALRVDHVFAARPVLMRAFQVAKRAAEPHARLGPDFVERGVEFRAVLHQLRRYLEVFAMFHRMDANDDRRVSLEDFELAVPLLVTWRVNPKEAKAKFLEADRAAAKGGIRFDEFVLWAMRLAPEKADEYDDSHHAARDDEIKAAFEFFDRNRSGRAPRAAQRARPPPLHRRRAAEAPVRRGPSLEHARPAGLDRVVHQMARRGAHHPSARAARARGLDVAASCDQRPVALFAPPRCWRRKARVPEWLGIGGGEQPQQHDALGQQHAQEGPPAV